MKSVIRFVLRRLTRFRTYLHNQLVELEYERLATEGSRSTTHTVLYNPEYRLNDGRVVVAYTRTTTSRAALVALDRVISRLREYVGYPSQEIVLDALGRVVQTYNEVEGKLYR